MNNVTVKSIAANYEKRQRERPKKMNNLITQQSNIWKLNVDVLLFILSFIKDTHLLPIILTCASFLSIVVNSKRNYEFQSIEHYCNTSVKMFQWILFDCCCKHWKCTLRVWEIIEKAAAKNLEKLQWLTSQNIQLYSPYSAHTCSIAAENGDVDMLKWLRSRKPRCPWNHDACHAAASGGHLEVLKWLRSQKPPCPWDEQTCTAAAENGHLNVLQWLRSQKPPCPWNHDACHAAAENINLDMLKWLRNQAPRCPWTEYTFTIAAANGDVDMLKWLCSQKPRCPWNHDACHAAARGGNLEVLKLLRSQKPPCPWNDNDICNDAARGGNLELLQWLRGQDPPCPWDASTCSYAAMNGYLGMLEWLRSEDPPCPWSKYACIAAAENGHLNVLQWLLGQDPPCPWEFNEILEAASRQGHLNVFGWIVTQFMEQNQIYPNSVKAINIASFNGHLNILQYDYLHNPNFLKHCVEIKGHIFRGGYHKLLPWINKLISREDQQRFVAYLRSGQI